MSNRVLDEAAVLPDPATDDHSPERSNPSQTPQTPHLLRLFTAVEQAHETIVITDADGSIQYVNPSFERVTGYSRDEALGSNSRLLKSGKHDVEYYRRLWETIQSGATWSGSLINKRKDGTLFQEEATISPVRDARGTIINFVAVKRDISEQIELENQLRQAQKLEAIGQLAAGVAHEINTPTQYVSDNIRFLKESFTDLAAFLTRSVALIDRLRQSDEGARLAAEAIEAMEQADVEFAAEEIPRAIGQSLEGVERIAEIVRAMKEFSHPSQEMQPTDLNRAIESTATVARNEWKYVAEIAFDLDPGLPAVTCLRGDFNQVMLNLIVNAAHAISEVVGDGANDKGTITVRTRHDDARAEIQVEDTGCGIPPDVQHRIFDPFFTTKAVGRGTGQGLSIAYSVITKKHGGTITVTSEPGRGTRFVIRLPLNADTAAQEATP